MPAKVFAQRCDYEVGKREISKFNYQDFIKAFSSPLGEQCKNLGGYENHFLRRGQRRNRLLQFN